MSVIETHPQQTCEDGECPEHELLNHYFCADCNEEWDDNWNCEVDNECPKCGLDISPYASHAVRDQCDDDCDSGAVEDAA